MQGIGRKIGARLDRLGREATVIQEMFAMLSAHSPDTSLSDYALDADAFRGISPEDKSAWAWIGAVFNADLYAEVEAKFALVNAGLPLQVNGVFILFQLCVASM